jgi:tellurite resistance protein TerC
VDVPIWFWSVFGLIVLVMLALDLGVFHRKAHAVGVREAAIWSAVWVALSLAFAAGVAHVLGASAGVDFITAYVLEKALAVDNVFVFVLVFAFLRTPPELQHRVLVWGVLGAIVMRGAMIAVGATLVEEYHAVLYVFGAILVASAVKMLLPSRGGDRAEVRSNRILLAVRSRLRVTDDYVGERFFVKRDGVRWATPLFLALVAIEISDLVFAVDSIPAVFAITTDRFIVFTSNVLAILGLRSMYFLLAGVVHRFVYLKTGLAAVLLFVGAKMIAIDVVHIPTLVSLGVIATILTLSIVASLARPPAAPLPVVPRVVPPVPVVPTPAAPLPPAPIVPKDQRP